MPANLTPQYHEAERRYKAAKTPAEEMACLEEMLRVIPKHKGTEKMRADLRRRRSKLNANAQKSGGPQRGFSLLVDSEGAGQIVMIGAPNVGKSALLATLTKAAPEVADYPFTTRKPMPGMVHYEDVQIQLVDLPPLSRDYMESWMSQIARNADALLLVIDLNDADVLDELELVLDVLGEWKIQPVDHTLTPEEREVEPLPTLLLGNKYETPDGPDNWEIVQEFYGDRWPMLAASATQGDDLKTLRQALYDVLDVVRVYTKAPGKKATLDAPFTLPRGSTVVEVAATVHKDFAEHLKFARIWSTEKYEGQMVQRNHVVQDGDVIELHT
jgi:small GTP-binding protein